MTFLSHRNKFLMLSTLMCMVRHCTRPMVSNDISY